MTLKEAVEEARLNQNSYIYQKNIELVRWVVIGESLFIQQTIPINQVFENCYVPARLPLKQAIAEDWLVGYF